MFHLGDTSPDIRWRESLIVMEMSRRLTGGNSCELLDNQNLVRFDGTSRARSSSMSFLV